MMPTGAGRVVIIGGGHNGLVAAVHLAKAGFAPLVLEKRGIVGGVAAGEGGHPGFACPTLMHSVGPLLGLPGRAGQFVPSSHLIALHPDGRALRIHDDPQRTATELTAFSAHDANSYPEFHSCVSRLGAILRPMLVMT